jgi:predicted dithiol-disulfide oxidoreductase (DUF899 family)
MAGGKKPSYPNESPAYRKARDRLLAAEVELRAKVLEVAALRRRLPEGGELPEDYVFAQASGAGRLRLSQLFAKGKDTLALYSFMFAPDWDEPCPLCTSFLDSLEGAVPHAAQHMSLAVVSGAPPAKLAAFASKRGWRNLRLLSTAGNGYNRAYLAEDAGGNPWPMLNVLVRREGRIRHFWGSELLYAGVNGDPCHVDMVWPLWGLLDLTPAGRGDWYPALSYA